MNYFKLLLPILILTLAGCLAPNLDFGPEPTKFDYSEPIRSGLSSVKPYPSPDDICQVIREHSAIREPVNDGSFLIACPKHERGAIMGRLEEGAKIIAHARHWTILSVENIL